MTEPIVVIVTPVGVKGTCESAEVSWSEFGDIVWSQRCMLPATHHFERQFFCADHALHEAIEALREGLIRRVRGDAAEGEAAAEGGAAPAGGRSDTSPSPAQPGNTEQKGAER